MEIIRSSKKDLDGAVSLDHYVKKGQMDLDVTKVKRFFARNMKAIISRVPSRREREDNREQLKDFMSTLLESPPGNAISQTLEANRSKFGDSTFGHLIDITICESLAMLANQTDFNALRHMRQESG
uniref:Cytochrome P450 n=1 Tax=Strongyloides venezuelensis TaxID=75913 RepID=A0A0K0FWP5_STRVS